MAVAKPFETVTVIKSCTNKLYLTCYDEMFLRHCQMGHLQLICTTTSTQYLFVSIHNKKTTELVNISNRTACGQHDNYDQLQTKVTDWNKTAIPVAQLCGCERMGKCI